MKNYHRTFTVVVVLSIMGTAAACLSREAGSKDADISDAGVDVRGEAGLLDADPASDSAVQHDADSQTVDAAPNPHVVELPPSGQTQMGGFTNAGNIVAYADTRGVPDNLRDIFYYDLNQFAEFQITNRVKSQLGPDVYDGEIFFHDYQYSDPSNGIYQSEIHGYDVAAATEIRLTNSPTLKNQPKANQDYILFRSNEGCPTTFNVNLTLMNRHTTAVSILSDCDLEPETHSIGELFATWSARPNPNHNKDIFVHDLVADYTFRIGSTDFGEQYMPHSDDDHIIWQDHRDGQREIYMYTVSTGEEVWLTPDMWEQAWPTLRNGVAAWCDYRHSQLWGEDSPCDIYVYEVTTGAERRVTTQSRTWQPAFVDSGWLVYGLWMAPQKYKLYAHDLVSDGILTMDGHVIP